MPGSARQATNCTIYRDGDKVVVDTGQAPRQFQGVLSIVYAGTSAESLAEEVYPTDQLRALPTLETQSLKPDMRDRLVELGLLTMASKPTSGSTASDSRRVQSREQRRASRPRRTSTPASDEPVGWQEEYRAALGQVWDGWCFIFTPLIIVWVPFALSATALWSVVALGAYIEERLGAEKYLGAERYLTDA